MTVDTRLRLDSIWELLPRLNIGREPSWESESLESIACFPHQFCSSIILSLIRKLGIVNDQDPSNLYCGSRL